MFKRVEVPRLGAALAQGAPAGVPFGLFDTTDLYAFGDQVRGLVGHDRQDQLVQVIVLCNDERNRRFKTNFVTNYQEIR